MEYDLVKTKTLECACLSISTEFSYQHDVEDIKSYVLLSNNNVISCDLQERILLSLVNNSLKI
jgi:hypothetical protein